MRKHTWKVVSPTAPLDKHSYRSNELFLSPTSTSVPTFASPLSSIPVFHVPAMFSPSLRMTLHGVAANVVVHKLRVLELVAEGVIPQGLSTGNHDLPDPSHQNFGKLLRLGPVPVPKAAQEGAVDPLAVTVVVKIGSHLGPARVLCRLAEVSLT